MGPHSCSQLSCWISDTDLAEGFAVSANPGLLTRNWSSRREGGWWMLPSLPCPQEAWGARVPTPGAPPRSGQKVASVGTVPKSSKIILSTDSHFPRKRASIVQIHPKKAFDFTPSGPFLRVGVPSYAWHTPQGPLCGWVSAHAGDRERHQGREARRTG